MIDAVHSSRPSGSAPIQTATAEDSAARETAIPVETTAEAFLSAPPKTSGCQSTYWGERRPWSFGTFGAARVTSLP
jgi:hypothetical protein